MAWFTAKERALARALRAFPVTKQICKRLYIWMNYHLQHDRPFAYSLDRSTGILTVADLLAEQYKEYETFFGYYDKSPVSSDGFVICNFVKGDTTKKPAKAKRIHVGVIEPGETKEPLLWLESRAFNWQQGARAHWLDATHFIFNDFDQERNRYISRVYSVHSQREVRRFSYPVQDSYEKDYFLSLNYRRLYSLRPDYGYWNLPALSRSELADVDNDGIWKVDFQTGKAHLLYTLRQITEHACGDLFGSAVHYVNHIMVSPSGSQFIFLHRYYYRKRKFDCLMLANVDGTELRVLADHEMVSHCCWIDDRSILSYMRGPQGRNGYYRLDIEAGNVTLFGDGVLDPYGDGHPHVNGQWFVTDTYPDRKARQQLLMCNLAGGQVIKLAEFKHGIAHYGQCRCDLHPRLSGDGREVYVDSCCSGRRSLYAIDLSGLGMIQSIRNGQDSV